MLLGPKPVTLEKVTNEVQEVMLFPLLRLWQEEWPWIECNNDKINPPVRSLLLLPLAYIVPLLLSLTSLVLDINE
jgi:hypothetical protein